MEGERSIRNTLKERLEYEGYRIDVAESAEEAESRCATSDYDLVLCSMQTHGFDADHCLGKMKTNFPQRPVIVLSPVKSVDTVVEIMKLGADDFIPKPIDLNRLLKAIRDLSDPARAEEAPATNGQLNGEMRIQQRAAIAKTEEIVGESECIKHVKRLIDVVGPSDARVLITGSNGTGKELVAHWLHNKSPRKDEPFVEVNCAAIPSELIESELFGHEKGAFTSAIKQRKGKFEQADGGTLFLDEIGDMSLAAQAKVLRSLQENRISRVGSDRDITVNVRVIAATNKNLREEITANKFREDLYHRLSVIVIRVPCLGERRDDIPLLVTHFVNQICHEYGSAPKKVEQEAIDTLMEMEWPGNIRELRNVVERLIILSAAAITAADVETYAVGVLN